VNPLGREPETLLCERAPDAAAYVLGALDAHEVEPFREHMEECAACRLELTRLQAVADSLAIGVTPKLAPASLQARIMGTAHAESELLSAAGHEADRPARTAPRWRARPLPALAVAGALAVGLLIGALAINTGSTTTTATPQAQVVRAIVELPGAHATAELRRSGSQLQLVVVGMPAPPRGRIYEIWIVPRGAAAPQPTDALFSVTSGGDGSVDVPGNAQNLSEVLVTDEPLGGSLEPTRKPVIVATT
jgi:anti-sigma factor RsiW